ncbi:hypothetical protein HPB50_006556 [Hyalomma asiaticum]|uniref:Uncharacterized protein n=1 Tax=Hyalomma asiaticum TaxID=266040 RepID=A0ACB7TDH1_HYAAI|nr:hypothetical protein HPB50_006556 [Hyalomma asiaticum]
MAASTLTQRGYDPHSMAWETITSSEKPNLLLHRDLGVKLSTTRLNAACKPTPRSWRLPPTRRPGR